jgi:hypothetical protein
LGTKGRLDPRTIAALGFSSLRFSSAEPRLTTSGSYPLVGFVLAADGVLRNGVRQCFHHCPMPPIPPVDAKAPFSVLMSSTA